MGSDSDQEKPGPPAEPPKSKHKRISAETAGETTNPQRSPQVAKPAPKKTTKSASAAERFKRGVVGEVVRLVRTFAPHVLVHAHDEEAKHGALVIDIQPGRQFGIGR